MMDETGESPASDAPRVARFPRLALILFLLGVGILAMRSVWEARTPPASNLAMSIVVLGDGGLEEGIPVWAVQVPAPPGMVAQVAAEHGIDLDTWVIAADLTAYAREDLLAGGRWPEPGASEILAGHYAAETAIDLGGTPHQIVGRLRPGILALSGAYLLPLQGRERLELPGALPGRFLSDGNAYLNRLAAGDKDTEDAQPRIIAGRVPAGPAMRWSAFAGLALCVAGAAPLLTWLTLQACGRGPGIMRAFAHALTARPITIAVLHLLFYGVFFLSMLTGMALDHENFLLTSVIEGLLTQGQYQYIGDAYSSGNVIHAAWATYYNNFLIQTALLTIVLSIPPLGLGLFKTLLSLVLAGFVLAPNGDGGATVLAFHAITIAIELEAYILACFGVWLWTLGVYRGLYRAVSGGDIAPVVADGAAALLAGALVAAVMLGAAALYEAFTLIALAGF